MLHHNQETLCSLCEEKSTKQFCVYVLNLLLCIVLLKAAVGLILRK